MPIGKTPLLPPTFGVEVEVPEVVVALPPDAIPVVVALVIMLDPLPDAALSFSAPAVITLQIS